MANSIIRSFLSSRCNLTRKSLLGLISAFLLGVVFCVCSYADTVISDGFIHGYWFENNTADAMNTSNGANSKGTFDSSSIGGGFIGESIYFNNSAYVRLENSNNTDFGIAAGKDGKMTIMCWYYPTESTTNARVLISNEDWYKGLNPGVTIDAQYLTGPDFNFGDGVQAHRCEYVAKKTVANKWQFVAVSADIQAGTADLYYGAVDGNLQLLKTMDISNLDSFLSSYKWYLATDYSNYDYYFRGYMDEVAFWNRALTQDEVTSIFNNQKAGTGLGIQLARAAGGSVTQGDGTWDTDTNWSYRAVPDSQTDVIINHSITDSADRTVNANMTINNGGAYTSSGTLTLGDGENLTGTLTLNGGTVSVEGLVLSSNSGAGIVNLSAGTLNIGAAGVTAGDGVVPVINLGSGTINASDSHSWSNNLNIKLNDGATTTFNSDANKAITIESPISGSGALVKTGSGTLTLSGNNTFTGGTTVSEGTLTLTYINGTKGTLATGSTVTVDGSTSVLAGHGDVLGYSSGSVGTINLQNGGKLYNDSTGNHITVGAAINMNNGVITAVEDANGNGTFGNFVFDNAINVTGGEDNEISAKKITLRQYAGTSDEEVGGKITVASGAKLTISSQIAAHTSPTVVPLVKLGAGELVLSGDCTYTTGTFVIEGTLTLTKTGQKGTLAKGSTVTVDGATSILAGHGDVLGYSSDTVGTVNLQNGGTLYNDATADQKSHVTFAAVLNMNSGFVTADPNAQGSDNYGNFVFDNAINVSGGTDNRISANAISLRQYDGTPGNGGGKITVADGAKLTISSVIKNPNINLVPLVKLGAGELVLSGDCTFTTGTTVKAGKLTLTKVGDKGTLATGSTITVDGATSVLAGHGDILGYGSKTVGTVTLQNGGTLYNDATADQQAHITVGAAINMNNGYITADFAAQGSETFGNYVFDNAINVTGGTDNAISANQISLRQYNGTPGNSGGKITVADGAKLTISSLIKDPDAHFVQLEKLGDGELVLTTENTYSKGTTVSKGTLTLAGAGTTGSGTVAIATDGTLNFYVTAEEDPKQVNVTSANAISGTGKIVKSGNGVLRINNENADGSVKADSFTVNSGRLDYKGFFEGDIVVDGGTLSPGNSVGTLNVTGNVSVINGTALFEFDPYGSDSYDVLNVLGDNASFTAGESMIMLYFENEDAQAWAESLDEKEYRLVADDGFEPGDYSAWLNNYTTLFGLEGRGDGLYLVAAASSEPGSGVPEPSTWALLLLGVAGLLFWRKRK